ncbi:MAG: 4Fe-4S binding protein [Candidatus Hydrothermarchaeales archaeon]
MDDHTVEYSMRVEDDALVYTRESVREKRELIFRKDTCVGCWLCFDACPTDAISRNPVGIIESIEEDHPNIVIDPQECVLCGVCAEVCIFGSLDLTIDGSSIMDLTYPRLKEQWEWHEDKCIPKDAKNKIICEDCEVACPRGALKCELVTEMGKGKKAIDKVKNLVKRDEALCIYCTTCQTVCPEDAITVEKVFDGEINVDLDKCQGCGVCVDVCPSNALNMPKPGIGELSDKLMIDKDFCIYCSACVNSCPVEALSVTRTGIRCGPEGSRSATIRREGIFQELTTKK